MKSGFFGLLKWMNCEIVWKQHFVCFVWTFMCRGLCSFLTVSRTFWHSAAVCLSHTSWAVTRLAGLDVLWSLCWEERSPFFTSYCEMLLIRSHLDQSLLFTTSCCRPISCYDLTGWGCGSMTRANASGCTVQEGAGGLSVDLETVETFCDEFQSCVGQRINGQTTTLV